MVSYGENLDSRLAGVLERLEALELSYNVKRIAVKGTRDGDTHGGKRAGNDPKRTNECVPYRAERFDARREGKEGLEDAIWGDENKLGARGAAEEAVDLLRRQSEPTGKPKFGITPPNNPAFDKLAGAIRGEDTGRLEGEIRVVALFVSRHCGVFEASEAPQLRTTSWLDCLCKCFSDFCGITGYGAHGVDEDASLDGLRIDACEEGGNAATHTVTDHGVFIPAKFPGKMDNIGDVINVVVWSTMSRITMAAKVYRDHGLGSLLPEQFWHQAVERRGRVQPAMQGDDALAWIHDTANVSGPPNFCSELDAVLAV